MPEKGPPTEICRALELAPNICLILSIELYIITASKGFLEATQTSFDAIVGKHLLEEFHFNPDWPNPDGGLQNVSLSLQKVLQTKTPDYLQVVQYDIPDRNNPGKFIERFLELSHTPVLDQNDEISYIIQLANDVTEKILIEQVLLKNQQDHFGTTKQLEALNTELLLANIALSDTRKNLQILNGQLEECVERRTNELTNSENKIKKSFEEQQALNTQLATSNEEHAAVNEELVTSNEELNYIQQQLQAANEELAANSSRLTMAIESTQLGTWDWNPLNGELHWSKECREIYGIPGDLEASFELFSELIHPEDRDFVMGQISDSFNPGNKGCYDLIYRLIRHDDRNIRWIKVRGKVYFEDELPTRFIGTTLDITDIKLAQEESAKLAAIIAYSEDAVIGKTLESVITSWNNAATRLFGYTAKEMIGASIYKIIPEDRWQEEPGILDRINLGERVEHFETKRLTKEGRLLDMSVSVSPIRDSDGKIVGLSKIARDITERKLDEARKNDFIGMVSHELKTPLTSLNALLQVAGAKLKNSEDHFLAEAMQKANVQVKRMNSMINGFLDVSRLEAAKILVDKANFQLEELIEEVIEETKLTNGTHHIVFNSCDPVSILADRDKISSVLSNLIGNAIKYSPDGTAIYINCFREGHVVTVSVRDEGMGIHQEDANKIFDRYYRVQSNSSKHISGFGIGLYLSAEIVRRHDGEIWVESQGKKGSTFYFQLPLNII